MIAQIINQSTYTVYVKVAKDRLDRMFYMRNKVHSTSICCQLITVAVRKWLLLQVFGVQGHELFVDHIS